MSRLYFWLPLLLIGCTSSGVVKIGDNLYTVSEFSETLSQANFGTPDPAIDDINKAAKDYCANNQQKAKVLSMDRPADPKIRQQYYKLTFSCVNPDGSSTAPQTANIDSANAQRLQELKKLRDQGVITESQFETKRAEILQQM